MPARSGGGVVKKLGIREMQAHVHATAVSKGWWDESRSPPSVNDILAKLALVHSEVSEGVEVVRDPARSLGQTWVDDEGKPEGLGIELADAVIRIMDLCARCDIDLEDCIRTKAAYNVTRPHRHGGKAA